MQASYSSASISPGVLSRRLSSFGELSEREQRVVHAVEQRTRRSLRPRTRILVEGADMSAPLCLMAGWACHVRELADGRRQLVDVILPGDLIGLSARDNAAAPASVVALTPVKCADAPEMRQAWRNRETYAGLAAALDLCAAEEAAFRVDQVVRLGRQTAHERLSHLILEMEYRLARRGLSQDDAFEMPLTQEALGDILGLSIVHVNRTLQQMRRQDMIELGQGRLKLLDRAALTAAAEFRAPQLSVA